MKRLAFAFLLSWLMPVSAAQAAEPIVDSFTLENGMEVIVIENHRVPAVNHALWFRVGSADDPPLYSGLVHFHEHMMFQGSANFKRGEYADIIARLGGRQNAFTGYDATAYYVTVGKEHLPRIMELEADRLRGLTPTDKDALNEKNVIIEERRQRIENNPSALFAEQLNAALYLNHPYRLPVIGWKHEMEGLTKDMVLALHTQHYHPGNAILIVSGDITAAELKPLAQKYYGAIAAGPTIARVWAKEPPQLAARRLTMTHKDVKQPEWVRLYLAPGAGEEGGAQKLAALSLLEQILGGGKTSRLYQSLVMEQQLAASVGADYNGFVVGPGEFRLEGVPAPGVSVEKLEAAINGVVAQLIAKGIGAEELKRAKTLLKADTIYAREGLQSMGYVMGWLRSAGLSTRFYSEWPDMIERISAADIRQAAKELFDIKRSVTGTLLPESASPTQAEASGAS